MLKIRLKELLEENNITRYRVSKETKIPRNYIDKLYFEKASRITFDQIKTLCIFFSITPNELFVIESKIR